MKITPSAIRNHSVLFNNERPLEHGDFRFLHKKEHARVRFTGLAQIYGVHKPGFLKDLHSVDGIEIYGKVLTK